MPRLRRLEGVAKDWLLRPGRIRSDAMKYNATWLVREHSSTISFNCLISCPHDNKHAYE